MIIDSRRLIDRALSRLMSDECKRDIAKSLEEPMTRERVEMLSMETYGLPYPVDHFYLPLARPERIIEYNVDREPCVPVDSFLNMDRIYSFLEQIGFTEEEATDVPDWTEVHGLGYGLGYPGIDAYIYHAAVSKLAPPTVVEIGSGMSAYYAKLALARSGGHKDRLFCFEPFPAENFAVFCGEEGIPLIRERLEAIDPDKIISKIRPGSVLFVDSTHAFRSDGELPRILLRILPNLPAGCYVHFHDIFLPYAVIHREHNAFSFSHVWNESIALAAFLSGRNDFEVVLPAYWMGRHHMKEMVPHLPWLKEHKMTGSAFWIRKTR